MNYSAKEENYEEVLINLQEEKITLGTLAQSGHTYWRFSQSEPGRSIENAFAEYKPGEVTCAEDKEKYLSFVDETTIAKCFMYGDMLTKLVFDLDDEKFDEIKDCEVKYTGNSLGEYECCKLLTEKNFSLCDIETIKLMFSMVNNNQQFATIFKHIFGDLESRLISFGFVESANLVHYLKMHFEKNPYITKEEIMDLIEVYTKNT